jgi:transposase
MRNTKITTEKLDHFGIVAALIRKLKIIERIDEALPLAANKSSKVSHGERVAAMIINGLGFTDKPLYLSPSFFTNKALQALFGRPFEAEWLNDDALGRTLDAIYRYGSTLLFAQISCELASELNLIGRATRLDSTSLVLYGDYEDNNQSDMDNVLKPAYGHSKAHRSDLKQVIMNLAMTGSANLPIWFQSADGNVSDKGAFSAIVERINAFQKGLKAFPTDRIFIADSALYKKGVLSRSNWLWITRVPNTLAQSKKHQKQSYPEDAWEQSALDGYRFQWVSPPKDTQNQRWLLVQSNQQNKDQEKTLEKRIQSAQNKLETTVNRFIQQTFSCLEDAKRQSEKLSATSTYHHIEWHYERIEKYAKKGRPSRNQPPDAIGFKVKPVSIQRDERKIKPHRLAVGRFILATNEPNISADELLSSYKGQSKLEQGFAFMKSDTFQLDHLFLKKLERIDALMMVMTFCLLIYNYGQYELRQSLKAQNKTVPSQTKKATKKPTLRWVFKLMDGVEIAYSDGHYLGVINLNDVHMTIIQLFGAEAETIYQLR